MTQLVLKLLVSLFYLQLHNDQKASFCCKTMIYADHQWNSDNLTQYGACHVQGVAETEAGGQRDLLLWQQHAAIKTSILDRVCPTAWYCPAMHICCFSGSEVVASDCPSYCSCSRKGCRIDPQLARERPVRQSLPIGNPSAASCT